MIGSYYGFMYSVLNSNNTPCFVNALVVVHWPDFWEKALFRHGFGVAYIEVTMHLVSL